MGTRESAYVCVCVIIRNRARIHPRYHPHHPPMCIYTTFDLSAGARAHTQKFLFRFVLYPLTPTGDPPPLATRSPPGAPFREIDCSIFPRVFLPLHRHPLEVPLTHRYSTPSPHHSMIFREFYFFFTPKGSPYTVYNNILCIRFW